MLTRQAPLHFENFDLPPGCILEISPGGICPHGNRIALKISYLYCKFFLQNETSFDYRLNPFTFKQCMVTNIWLCLYNNPFMKFRNLHMWSNLEVYRYRNFGFYRYPIYLYQFVLIPKAEPKLRYVSITYVHHTLSS